MSNRSKAELIATLLARYAMNDSPAEAEAALNGAYTRMQREGVSLDDLLALSDGQLYQKGLIALVDKIVADATELSEAGKRELYARYVSKIAQRFSTGSSGGSSASGAGSTGGSGSTGSTGSGYTGAGAGQGSDSGAAGGTDSFTDWFKSPSATAGNGFSWQTVQAGLLHSASNLAKLFHRGGFFWHVLYAPGRAFKLVCAASLVGLGGGLLFLIVAGSFHSFLSMGGPWLDLRFKSAWAISGVLIGLWQMRALYREGWF
jgi:hypothetical protein